jgi:hypothetical protein
MPVPLAALALGVLQTSLFDAGTTILSNPLSWVLLGVGALITTFSIAFFGYLAVGALFSSFGSDGSSSAPGRTPPPRE